MRKLTTACSHASVHKHMDAHTLKVLSGTCSDCGLLWHATLHDLLLCAGAQIFGFKTLSDIDKKVRNAVRLGGVACSDTSCVLVQPMQQFGRDEVVQVIAIINTLK